MIIYTESDYLEAHLTEISADTHNFSLHMDVVPQFLTDALKKLGHASSPDGPPSNSGSSKSRPR